MIPLYIQYENQQEPNILNIPKQICLFPNYNQNTREIQRRYQVIEKFLKALHQLQIAQSQPNKSIKYPILIQMSSDHIMVDFGKLKTDTCGIGEFIFSPQNYYVPCYHTQAIPQCPKIQLPIQKKRQISFMQDQKDSKNIPKNYCKSIITFACKNQDNLCLEILKDQLKVVKFVDKISQYKKQLLNIKIFSNLLQKSDDPEEEEYRRAFRIISQIFIKKQAINYIFNSKIVQYNWHMRYRLQIYKGVKDPDHFSHLKNL
ncbi:unnamed protein product (macronuclear) [Paramecium tetraurelia]|uniref:PX domain-containing protein n=1 Tax=Paramecium tetraurelia TaxID=5888 RepID=A0D8P8_PARTE|nr:uncharacterized protein GSPATT00014361001 [Paramecium tetraurelia]CAK79415.1 unnamed protein product [Paramecium tetraurelia]|eukprot:XP_001446812.1 hypothetical protein (macronuclear) [Paramecium tetraurelia strain d4-2]